MNRYKDGEEIEAEAVGYGEGHPPFFTTAFVVFIQRDRVTGGLLGVTHQTKNILEALTKAQGQMGLEREATALEVVSACREIVSMYEQQAASREIASAVVRMISAEDRAAAEKLDRIMGARKRKEETSVGDLYCFPNS